MRVIGAILITCAVCGFVDEVKYPNEPWALIDRVFHSIGLFVGILLVKEDQLIRQRKDDK